MSEIHITRAVYKDTNELVSIDVVESGLQDNVVCACCGAKLIANKGKKKAWHFSHYVDESCALAYETQLHLTAKEYFTRVGVIPVPMDAGWVTPDSCSELKISGVQVEVYMDGRRPDLVVEVGSEQYWIEIANKHRCGADKIWECRANNKNVIEIDVSDCGHLDQFNSLDNCVIKFQSINICNDYLDEVASRTASKHETVRRQFEALMRSQKQLEKESDEQKKDEKTLEERVKAQQKKYEERLEKMRVRESAQDEILAELEQAVGAIEARKLNLENEINELIQNKLVQLDEQNTIKLRDLQRELESDWQRELVNRRDKLEHTLADEFQRRFQEQLDVMNRRQVEHQKLCDELKVFEHDKDFLNDEIESLLARKQQLQDQQAKQIEEELKPLAEQRDTLYKEVDQLTSIVKEKLVELDLVDTYAGNIAEVKEFCLARSDYRETLNQRMQDLKSIKDQCQSLRTEYEKKSEQLDIMVKLSNDFAQAFKSSFDLLKRKELMEMLPDVLVKRVSKNVLLLPRNAKEELDDYERLN
ncbi:competence protein CoiA family protein [Vibrio vulnificus]|uniref:competence protein CoiA family protein n=1 Tax=Vibrio vulnificus TaxID=672 RepID=UPI00405A3604